MKLIRGRHDLHGGLAPSVVSIGNFDGVHLGHLQLIKTLCGQADRYDLPPTVMTFDPHPHEYFSPQTAPPRLSSFREKLTYLEQAGIHNVVCIRFDQRFSQTSATDFIQEYLVKGLGARFVVVGDDFRFGLNRKGDLALLRSEGEIAGFGVASVGTFVVDGQRVSSSSIRRVIEESDFGLAERLLGRPYGISGRVIYGDQRGRTWGFPTANIALRQKNIPVRGVYAVTVKRNHSDTIHGVVNIGFRPTIGGEKLLLEAHLLDFDQDIYGERLRVEFRRKIRGEARFESFDVLRSQIAKDVEEARKWLQQEYPL